MTDRTTAVPESLAGSLAGRYVLEREVGRGGMATVYVARDLKHERRVAVKVLTPDMAAEIGRERFLREIAIAAQLTHPHILPLHDSGAVGDYLYYVTPYIEGDTLRSRLGRERRLPIDEALRLTREIASALGYAHQRGLVHRDIKPENVLLADGLALVADFGIARPVAGAEARGLTSAGMIVGTPTYMAPEQALGSPDVDGRSDLYSLACVAYEMIAGGPPFTGTVASVVQQHITATPPPVSEARPDTPGGVAEAIARGLAKAPGDRYQNAARFVEALLAPDPLASTIVMAGRAPVPHNLPADRTPFIGRERDLAQCRERMADARLLTLTGIGGCGKTRLAQKLAEQLLDRFPDGVWFVDLAPLGSAEGLPEAVATTLGVRPEPGRPPLVTLEHHLAGRRVLLVLDNGEVLRSACAALADALLAATRHLRILVTSREALGIPGETVHAVGPLPVPEARALGPEAALEYDSVRLFVDRARMAFRDFALTPGNAVAVMEICRRLDGIPLAIELAASRVKLLSVEQIRSRLDDRFRLLGGGPGALPRHQTLRTAIQWSYDQLTPEEQALFRRFSLFAGGWSLDSATRLAALDDDFQVLEVIARLVDKSLVVVERRAGEEPRYHMLETVRQFGAECLTSAGELDAARARHLEEFLALAERAYQERLAHEEAWCARLELEHDNLRAALETARTRSAEEHLRLAGALGWFRQLRSHLVEGRESLAFALQATAADPPRPARARALWGVANIMAWQGEGAAALAMMREALAHWRQVGDAREVAMALEGIGWAQVLAGQDLASCATFEECLRLQEAAGDPVLVNRARVGLAQVLVALHRIAEARPMAERILAFSAPRGDRRNEHFGWHFLADCALIEGRCEESLQHYQTALRLAEAIGDRTEIGFEIQGIAMSLAGMGEEAGGLRLSAAAEAEWERIGLRARIRFWDDLLERYLRGAEQRIGSDAAERVRREGRGMAFDQAIRTALDFRPRAS